MRRKVVDLPPMPPGYNITPGTFQPVDLRLDEETSEREIVLIVVDQFGNYSLSNKSGNVSRVVSHGSAVTNTLSVAAKPTLVGHHAKCLKCQSSSLKSDLSNRTRRFAKFLLCNRA